MASARTAPNGQREPPRWRKENAMTTNLRTYSAAVAAVGVLLASTAVRADTWNERTVLSFSDSVMVPGATLEPGSYVFTLLDSNSSRHVVQVLREDSGELVVTTHAVPVKRAEPRGDHVLRFSPVGPGEPPALKAWFYPGSVYGHQFVYSDEEARKIAGRTRSVVLSIDSPGTDLEHGTLYTYDAEGIRGEWRADEGTMVEWGNWQHDRAVRHEEWRAATAPAIATDRAATRVTIDALEDQPSMYIGWTVSVDGEVETVYGPRLFTIDEPRWGDLEDEVIVYVPSALAATVREHDRVTVTGKVTQAVTSGLQSEWGWPGLDPETVVGFATTPILVATRLVGGNDDRAYLIEETDSGAARTGMRPDRDAVSDLSALVAGGEELVGRHVSLQGVRVADASARRGFFVENDGTSIFILPAKDSWLTVKDGDTIAIEGVVLQAPRSLKTHGDAPDDLNEDVYVMATTVT
jgi:hypothetical protein